MAAPTLGIAYPVDRPSLTHWQSGFWKCANTSPAGPTSAQLGSGFVPQHPLMSYSLWLCLILDILKICMDLGPYDAFPSSYVPEMVDQQNSWNSLVITTYLLYFEWNECMLVVNICILWLPRPLTLRVLLVPEQKKRIKSWGHKQELYCHNCSRIKNTTYNSYLSYADVSKSWTICCWKIGTIVSLYLLINACNHMVYLTLPFSHALSLNHSSSQSLFSSQLIFLWWFTLKRYPCHTLYIVKAKENSREFLWQIIMVDREWYGNVGKKGKSQGIKGSANAYDVWVWMMPHIEFYTIGKCDLFSFFLLIESLPAACKFHPLFFF
jgi:hypothetical protein